MQLWDKERPKVSRWDELINDSLLVRISLLSQRKGGGILSVPVCLWESITRDFISTHTHTMPDRTIKQSDYTPIVQLQIHFLFKLDAHPAALFISPKTETLLLCCHPEVPFVAKMPLLGKIWTFPIWSRLYLAGNIFLANSAYNSMTTHPLFPRCHFSRMWNIHS